MDWPDNAGNHGRMSQETLAGCYKKPWPDVAGNRGRMLQETVAGYARIIIVAAALAAGIVVIIDNLVQ